MNNEILSQLQDGLFTVIIALFFAALVPMFIGYGIVGKRLAQRGMKKGDAKAIGKLRHHSYFC